MSLVGSLADVSVVDLMQFVHLGMRSGTLFLEDDAKQAQISFQRGRIVSAYGPTSPSVRDLLLEAGTMTAKQLELATVYRSKSPALTLGQALVATSAVTPEALRDAITRKVERTVFDLIEWIHGEFRFDVDDVHGEHEIALIPSDVIAPIDINTEMVLIEALRLFDERNERQQKQRESRAIAQPQPRITRQNVTIQLVTSDHILATNLNTAITDHTLRMVAFRDAGNPVPSEQPPLVILDVRKAGGQILGRFRARHPRVLVVAITETNHDPRELYAAGVAAAVPADPAVIASVCSTLLGARGSGEGLEVDLRSIGRLRRVISDLRGGIVSATLSLNLMTIVADSVDRAVLFLVRDDSLIALGAFGSRVDNTPLVGATKGLTFGATDEISSCITDGRARAVAYDAHLSLEMRNVIDRPASGHGVLFPVLGSRRVIALIYADNGQHHRSIEDVEIVEIATAQVGLAFENELLRRQLDRHSISH